MIAYDTNILIYALENTCSWAAAAQAVVRQREQDGAVLLVLIWQELMTGAVLRRNGQDEELAKISHSLGSTKLVSVSQAICERAVSLTKRYGKHLYGYGAIHLATAMEYKAEVFVTNDKAILNISVDKLIIQGL